MVLSSFAAIASGQIQIILGEGSVIGSGGHYFWKSWNESGPYDASNVVDNQTGAVTETAGDDNYWLGRQASLNQFFVLDLGQAYPLARIALFNTHNNTIDDRGTRDFVVHASNDAAFVSATDGYNLSSAVQILSGTLDWQLSATDPIDAQAYSSANGLEALTAYRYLRFTALNYYGVQGAGLSEIRIFAVPEPSTWTLLLGTVSGLGAVLVARRRRRDE